MTCLRRCQLLSLISLAIMGAPTCSAAPAGPRPIPAKRGVPMRQVIEELGLTPSQRRDLMTFQRGRRLKLRAVTREIGSLRRSLADLYRSYPLDEGQANSLIKQITVLEEQRLRLQLRSQVELRRILSQEQFQKFSRFVEPNRVPGPPPDRAAGP